MEQLGLTEASLDTFDVTLNGVPCSDFKGHEFFNNERIVIELTDKDLVIVD